MALPEGAAPASKPRARPSVATPAQTHADALELAALGYPPVRCAPNTKKANTPNGKDDAQATPEYVAETFTRAANLGMLPPVGVLALDIDVPKNDNDEPLPGAMEHADRIAADLEANYPELRTAPKMRTRSDGLVYIAALPEGVTIPSRVRTREWLDLRGDGRTYVLVPPSRINGRAYSWLRPLVAPEALPVASAELLEYLTPPPVVVSGNGKASPAVGVVELGEDRDVTAPEPYAREILEGARSRLAAVGKGGRHAATLDEARVLGRWIAGYQTAGLPYLTEAEARDALEAACDANGYTRDDGAHAVARTIADGLAYGMARPFRVTVKEARARDPEHLGPPPRDPSDPLVSDGEPAPQERLGKEEAAEARKRRPRLTTLSTVRAEEVQHLDDGRLILGKLTLLVGDAGMGKTTVALAIGANVTQGRPIFPKQLSDGSHIREPRNVLALIGEDGLADTIRARFDALDGDAERFHVLTGMTYTDSEGTERDGDVDLTQLDVLEDAIRQTRPALVIVDPVQVYLGPGADMHRANEVRASLRGAAQLAEKHRAALLILGHLNKGNGKALYRALGSIDFVAIARSVLLAGEHDGKLALAHAKANLSPKAPTLTYTLDGGTLAWTGKSEATADDLTSGPPPEYQAPKQAEAADWLEVTLQRYGSIESAELMDLAKKANIAWRTLNRVKEGVGVKTRRIGTPGAGGRWIWELEE